LFVQAGKHPNGKDFAYGPQMVEISRYANLKFD